MRQDHAVGWIRWMGVWVFLILGWPVGADAPHSRVECVREADLIIFGGYFVKYDLTARTATGDVRRMARQESDILKGTPQIIPVPLQLDPTLTQVFKALQKPQGGFRLDGVFFMKWDGAGKTYRPIFGGREDNWYIATMDPSEIRRAIAPTGEGGEPSGTPVAFNPAQPVGITPELYHSLIPPTPPVEGEVTTIHTQDGAMHITIQLTGANAPVSVKTLLDRALRIQERHEAAWSRLPYFDRSQVTSSRGKVAIEVRFKPGADEADMKTLPAQVEGIPITVFMWSEDQWKRLSGK